MADSVKQKEFSNWVYNVLALNITKTALHALVLDKLKNEISTWNIKSLNDFLEFLQDVENGQVRTNTRNKEKVLECRNCQKMCQHILGRLHCLRQDKSFTISCKSILCGKILKNDVREPDAATLSREVSNKQIPTKNTEKPKPPDDYSRIFPECKITHIWCIANMFMKSESFRNNICNTCPADTDAAMFFRLMKNCNLFDLDGDKYLYEEIINIRNKLHHSDVNRVKTQDSDTNLETMKNLLQQFPTNDCKDAATEIEKMKGRRFLFKEIRKAMFLKTFALEIDKMIAKSKGQKTDDIEYLQMETKEQFKHTRFTQFLKLKSKEEFKKENKMFKEKLGVLMKDHSRLDIQDLEEDLKEQMIEINETMNVKESDKENKEKQKLLSSARDIEMELHDIREKRLEVTTAIEENSQGEDFLDIIGNLGEELKHTNKELSDMLHHIHTSSKQNGYDLKETSDSIIDPDRPETFDIEEDVDFEGQDENQSDCLKEQDMCFIFMWFNSRQPIFVAKRDNIEKLDIQIHLRRAFSERFDDDSYQQLQLEYNIMMDTLGSDEADSEESNSSSTGQILSSSDQDILWIFSFPAGVRESAKERFVQAVKKLFSSDPSRFVLAPDTLLVLKYFMSTAASNLNIDGNVSEAQKKNPFEKGTKCMVIYEGWELMTVSTFEVKDSGTIQHLASVSQKSLFLDFINDVKDGVYQHEFGLVDTIVVLWSIKKRNIEELKLTGKCIISPKEDDYLDVLIEGGLFFKNSPLSLI